MSTIANTDVVYLGSGFTPNELDVIVGRGKVCYKHSGNLRLARIVQSVLTTYSSTEATKKSKTELIKSIVTQIRESSPDGGFVKFDSEKGEWFEVGDRTAREKVSQAFRDALTDQYKSSSTSKTLKRRQERITRQISYRSDESDNASAAGNSVDPVSALPFGSMSLASPPPRSGVRSLPSPRNSFGLPSPSPRGSLTLDTRSPRGSFVGLPSPSRTSTLGLTSPSPRATGLPTTRNLVSPAASFSQSPGHQLSARFSASPSPLAMSLAAQNAGLGAMGESPSSLRLAVAIAERKRRLTNLNMIIAARRNAGQSVGGLGRPQVPQF